jgi:hypothetical protein
VIEPGAFHFYAQGIALADFGSVFAGALRPLDVLIVRMPPDLLNPNYWEPLTRDAENEVRGKMEGIVTRNEGERTLVWRSDRVARGRLLRDDIDAPVELLCGYIFRTTGEGLLRLAQGWNGRGRLEWAGLRGLPQRDVPRETLNGVHKDIAQMRVSLPNEAFLYSTEEDDRTRVVFADRADLRRAIEALIRGFAHAVRGTHAGRINNRVIDHITKIADGVGLSASPDRDVTNKGRTLEIRATLGRTPWGTVSRPRTGPFGVNDRVLIYYDCVCGIWAVSA